MGVQLFRVNIWTVLIVSALFLFGCQKIEQPRTELTQSQWRDVQTHLLDDEPEPEHAMGVEFGEEVELIGFDVDGEFTAGQEVTITWYWRALKDVKQDWRIFVHLDSETARHRQNLDHYPLGEAMNDIYRTYHWKEGHIIEDVHPVTLGEDYPGGDALFYVGLYHGDTRSPVSNSAEATDDNRAIGPKVAITGPSAETGSNTPRQTIPHLDTALADMEVDGQLDEAFWRDIPSFRLSPISRGGGYQTSIKAAYSDEAIIIGARLEDEHMWTTLEERDQDLWTEEVLEVFLAPSGSSAPYVELQINPLGTIFDARFETRPTGATREAQINEARAWNLEGLQSAVFADGTVNDADQSDNFWSVEMIIPFEGLELGDAPSEDNSWRVNVYRFDRPDDNTTHAYGWATDVGGDFHRADRFGHWSFGASLQNAPPVVDLNESDRERIRNTVRRNVDENLQPSE